MQIILAMIYGAAVGALAHYTVPGRDLRGVAFAPMLGAVVGGAVWLLSTWLGLGLGNAWLWGASAIVPPLVVYGVVATMTRARRAGDARRRAGLGLI